MMVTALNQRNKFILLQLLIHPHVGIIVVLSNNYTKERRMPTQKGFGSMIQRSILIITDSNILAAS